MFATGGAAAVLGVHDDRNGVGPAVTPPTDAVGDGGEVAPLGDRVGAGLAAIRDDTPDGRVVAGVELVLGGGDVGRDVVAEDALEVGAVGTDSV
jgi:hypothetical protein